ncbi:hypothetical protein SUDANB95_05483 [Actinosynnema sp. ALI-1.44]
MSARLRHAGAHAAPRPHRDGGQRADLANHVVLLLAVLVVLVHLPAVALVWVAALGIVAVLAVLLIGRVLQLGRPVPDKKGTHRG